MLRSRRVGIGAPALAIAALLTLGACGDSYDDGSSGTNGDGTTADAGATGDQAVTIEGFAFNVDKPITAGQAFTVHNADGTTHTFTDTGGAFDVSVPGGGDQEVTIETAGTYDVVCKIHGSMQVTITAD